MRYSLLLWRTLDKAASEHIVAVRLGLHLTDVLSKHSWEMRKEDIDTPMTMKFGVIVPQGWRMDLVGIQDPVEAYETMTHVAQIAEELGYDSIWLFDHFHTVPVPTQEVTFECWTSTAALARDTKSVRIGQIVTCNGY